MNSRGSRVPYQSREAAEQADRSHDPSLTGKIIASIFFREVLAAIECHLE
jgi:hypothetical protein